MTHVSDTTTPDRMVFSEPETFDDPALERQHRKQRVAAALRVFARLGFDIGVAGHITARDPEHEDRFWVNPFGLPFSQVRASDLLLVDHNGAIHAGSGVLNTAAFKIHSEVHAARPDVVAAAHAHSTYGSAWSAMCRPLQPLTNEGCFFFEDHVLHDDHTGVTLEDSKAKAIAANLGGHRAAFLRNHGPLTVGASVDEAAWWFIALDQACRVQFLADSAGGGTPASDEDARSVRDSMGTSRAGWFSFQPLYREAVAAEPDLLV